MWSVHMRGSLFRWVQMIAFNNECLKLKNGWLVTIPPVEKLRRMQATTEPSNCAIQYKMLLNKVMFPPTKAPNVTAGFTWPPDMFAPTETATKSANAWDNDATMRPAGVAGPLLVSLSATTQIANN